MSSPSLTSGPSCCTFQDAARTRPVDSPVPMRTRHGNLSGICPAHVTCRCASAVTIPPVPQSGGPQPAEIEPHFEQENRGGPRLSSAVARSWMLGVPDCILDTGSRGGGRLSESPIARGRGCDQLRCYSTADPSLSILCPFIPLSESALSFVPSASAQTIWD